MKLKYINTYTFIYLLMSDLDQAFVPLAFQIAKDKPKFSDEEKNSTDEKWYWKKINDPAYLKTPEYSVTTTSNTSVEKLQETIGVLLDAVTSLTNRVSKLESLLLAQSKAFVNELSEKPAELETQTVTHTEVPKSEPESKPEPYSYNDDVVVKLLNQNQKDHDESNDPDNQSKLRREQYVLKTIRNSYGYGKMSQCVEYDDLPVPTENEINEMKNRLTVMRSNELDQMEPNQLGFAIFSQKCDDIVNDSWVKSLPGRRKLTDL